MNLGVIQRGVVAGGTVRGVDSRGGFMAVACGCDWRRAWPYRLAIYKSHQQHAV